MEALSFLLLAHFQAMERNYKKKQQQLKSIANHARPIAGATGAATSEEIPVLQETPDTRQRASREVYSVRFLQHELEQ